MSISGRTRVGRRTLVALAVGALLVPAVGWGAFRALADISGDALQWAASESEDRDQFEWFVERFDSADSILVSWPGCRLDDTRLDRFAEAVRRQMHSGEPAGGNWFLGIVTGREALRDLVRPPVKLPAAEAIRRLRGVFLGPDGRTTCAVITVSSEASQHARQVVGTIRQMAHAACGVPSEQIHLAGVLTETASIDEASLDTLIWLCVPSAVLAIAVAWPCLKSLGLTLCVYLGAVLCQGISLAVVHYTGGSLNGMLCVMPILVLVVFVSGAVHLIHYRQEAATRLDAAGASSRALQVGWFPCALAVTTSAVGVASLLPSRIECLRSFGLYASLGMLAALAVLLVLLPVAFSLVSDRPAPPRSPARPAGSEAPARRSPSCLLAGAIVRHHGLVTALCLLVALAGVFGLTRVNATLEITDFLAPGSTGYQDHVWLEKEVGPLMPTEVVLRFPADSDLSMSQKVQVVREVEQAVRSLPGQVSTVSLATMLPGPDGSRSMRGTVGRTMLNRKLAAEKKRLAATPYLRLDEDAEWWRITVRSQGISRHTDESTPARLETVVRDAVADAATRHTEEISVAVTGLLPLLAGSHETLLADLGSSFGTSVVLIGILLTVGLRSLRLGLISTLPNVFPIVVVFGAMGLLGRSIDVGTMLTASVGMGIAVDDTVHLLTWFTRGRKQGLSRREALTTAYRHCATAMLRTTAICGAGLGAYILSPFPPAAQFGWVICVLLLTALVGDLLLLPALIAGPVGAFLFPEPDARRASIRHWIRLGKRLLPAALLKPRRRPLPGPAGFEPGTLRAETIHGMTT